MGASAKMDGRGGMALLCFFAIVAVITSASDNFDDILPELAQDLGVPAKAGAQNKQVKADAQVPADAQAANAQEKVPRNKDPSNKDKLKATAQVPPGSHLSAVLKPKKKATAAAGADIYGMTESDAVDALTSRTEDLLRKDLTPRPTIWPSKEEMADGLKAKQAKARLAHDDLKVAASKELVKDEKAKVETAKKVLGHLGVKAPKAGQGKKEHLSPDMIKTLRTGALDAPHSPQEVA